jgi:hypothetical protein
VQTDGGGAVVITTAQRARDARKPAVSILGAGESHTHWQIAQMPDLTASAAAASARAALEMAGVTPGDIDVFEPYDSFTISVIVQLGTSAFAGAARAARSSRTAAWRQGASCRR